MNPTCWWWTFDRWELRLTSQCAPPPSFHAPHLLSGALHLAITFVISQHLRNEALSWSESCWALPHVIFWLHIHYEILTFLIVSQHQTSNIFLPRRVAFNLFLNWISLFSLVQKALEFHRALELAFPYLIIITVNLAVRKISDAEICGWMRGKDGSHFTRWRRCCVNGHRTGKREPVLWALFGRRPRQPGLK